LTAKFIDLADTEEKLNNYWTANQDVINKVKAADTNAYLRLVDMFKKQKAALKRAKKGS